MSTRTNKAFDLARMMIKQAKMLKSAGLVGEARGLAKRALTIKDFGHRWEQQRLQPAPLRISRHR
jgi:hypothetical protein